MTYYFKCGNFKISPKNFDKNYISGCLNCKYIDLCYRKAKDVEEIKKEKLVDFLGGEKQWI